MEGVWKGEVVRHRSVNGGGFWKGELICHRLVNGGVRKEEVVYHSQYR